MTRACMGGTFDPFHRGHRRLLERAFQVADEVFIGITSDAMARRHRRRRVADAATRLRRMRGWLQQAGHAKRAEVAVIDHPFGRALEPGFDLIVVSEETGKTAEKINAARIEADVPPLLVEVVPFALGLDGLPINATRVARGEIDAEGFAPRRIVVAAGTSNPSKARGIKAAFGRFTRTVRVIGVDVDHGTPEQPYDDETVAGAVARATRALEATPAAGLGVGVEAGILRGAPGGHWLDVQYCAIADRSGRLTLGHGPGFAYPPAVLERLRKDWSVGRAVGEITGRRDIGAAEGAIGFLTRGTTDRAELTEWAVLAALVPRLRPDLYDP